MAGEDPHGRKATELYNLIAVTGYDRNSATAEIAAALDEAMREGERRGASDERERCARVADRWAEDGDWDVDCCRGIAANIRDQDVEFPHPFNEPTVRGEVV